MPASSATRRVALALGLASLIAAACADESSAPANDDTPRSTERDAASGPAPTATPSGVAPSTDGPELLGARYFDRDHSGGASASDEVVLRFDRPVRASSADATRELALTPSDVVGSGASLESGPTANELTLRLGTSPRLSITGTYLPGEPPGPGKSPARVALSGARRQEAIVGAGGELAKGGAFVPIFWGEPDTAPVEVARHVTEPTFATSRAYFGNLHAHTGFSDGKLDPAQAHAHARGVGLDFMATSDHLEQLDAAEWSTTAQMATAEARAGTYVTLRGFEWGHAYQPPLGWYNHVNVIGSTDTFPLGPTSTLGGLYKAATSALGDGAIAIFNHPYISKPPLIYNQWDDHAYDGSADRVMSLIDCEGNGSKQAAELGYLPTLAKGWHVAPSSNQDNHDTDWGDKNAGRTGVWLTTLDGAAILRAVREGRAFSTGDKNASVRLSANGAAWMGSTVLASGPVALRVEIADADSETFDRVELWSNGAVVQTVSLKSATPPVVELTVDPAVDTYFFARVYQADGDELFSAPIYVDR